MRPNESAKPPGGPGQPLGDDEIGGEHQQRVERQR